jgi:ferredoxin
MATYRVLIDRSLCAGYGICAELAPDVIALDERAEAALRVGETDDETVLSAATECPMGAIAVFETAGGRRAA